MVAELNARDSFKVCNECASFSERSNISIANLIAKKGSAIEEAKASPKKESSSAAAGCLGLIVLIGVGMWGFQAMQEPGANQMLHEGLFVATNVAKPVVQPFQVPVEIKTRDSWVPNFGTVLQIRNRSSQPLIDVAVFAGESISYVIPVIQPGETVEVGALELNYILRRPFGIKIQCGRYLPVMTRFE